MGEGGWDCIKGEDRAMEQELVFTTLRIKLENEIFYRTIRYGCKNLTADKSSRLWVLIATT